MNFSNKALNLWLKRISLSSRNFANGAVTETPVLYYDDVSPPVRFVMMTAKYYNVDLKLHKIDLFKEENRTEQFVKINPLQKIPAMTIENNTIIDSHAISLYLCQKYKNSIPKGDSLYPEDALVRAKIHEMMFYNSGTLFPIDSAIFTALFAGDTSMDDKLLKEWSSAIDYLESRLLTSPWMSGDQMTLSDVCCAATVSSLELLIPLQEAEHPRLNAWLRKIGLHPFYDCNKRGLERLRGFLDLIK